MTETVNQEITTTAEQQAEARTFTQAEVNQIVADRIARERNKYADYADLKAKAAQFDAAQQQLAALNKSNELRDLRNKVSEKTGVPAHLLTGETEESCTAQAQEILKFSRPSYPVVQDGGEPRHLSSCGDDLESAFSPNKKHKPKELYRYL